MWSVDSLLKNLNDFEPPNATGLCTKFRNVLLVSSILPQNERKNKKNRPNSTRDWSPKFATGLNILIGIVQKVYE